MTRLLDASSGAGKLLGVPRDEIIGRSLDDFADPSFKPQITELWQAFLERGKQEGTLNLVGPDGKIGHAELKIGDSHVFLSDEFPGMNSAPTPGVKNACGIFLYLENVDAAFNRAVAAGAKVDMPLENQFWGDRYGKITDPFGHQWGLSQHIEDVAPAEMERRSKEWQAKMAKAAAAGKS